MKNKLNLKGQFNNSQTAVNPTEVGPATVNRRSKLTYICCLFAFLTLGVGEMWGKLILVDMGSAPNWYDNAHIHYYSGSDKYVALTSTGITNIYQATIPDSHGDGWRLCRYVSGTRYNDGNWISDNSSDNKKFTYGGSSASTIVGLVTGGYIYFDNSATQWTGNIQFVIGRGTSSGYSRTYEMTQISNTKIWYVNLTDKDNHQWWDATYYGFIASASKFGDGGWGSNNLSKATKYSAAYTSAYSLNDGSTYWCVPSGTTNGSSFTITYKTGYDNIPKLTASSKVYTRTKTGSTYTLITSGSWPTTISIQGTVLNGNGTSNRTTASTSTGASGSYNAVSSGLITMSYTSSDNWYFEGWTKAASTAANTSTTSTCEYNITAATTAYAYFTQKHTVTFGIGGTSGSSTVSATAGGNSISTGAKIKGGTQIVVTATPATGYEIVGWYSNSGCTTAYTNGSDGVTISADKSTFTLAGSSLSAAKTIYVKFQPKTYTVTLSYSGQANYGSAPTGVKNSVTATYGKVMPAMGTAPKATNGYGFYGYYTEANGNGTKYYNADGTSAKNWDLDENTTLYAYFRQAAITGFTFSPSSTVAPSEEIEVTANIDPVPEGTNTVCWEVQYNNGNPLEDQPTFTPETGTTVWFNVPATSGTYKVEATLHLGAGCEGTVLSTAVQNFQVAGDHTVTVQYKCGNTTIAASTTVNGKPLEWSSKITAPDIFGYVFNHWEAVDGITLSTNGTSELGSDQTTNRDVYIKAIYDGKLIAVYTKKDFIYFKNTLGWSNAYVYFYADGGYFDDNNGAGATGSACIGKGKMNLVEGETDVYYWDYGENITGGAAKATKYVAFTADNGLDHSNFNGFDVVYPINGNISHQGFSPGTPMFVPLAKGVQPNPNYTKNGSTPYFDRGYWTNYTGRTGYSIDIFYSKGGSYDKSVDFVRGESEGMPYTATVNLTGNTTLGIKIHRSNSIYYYSTTDINMSNAATAKDLAYNSGASNQTGITTNASGDYIFTLTCAATGELQISVKYPAKAGDYRVLYTDNTRTGYKPSAVVPQVNNGKDTVSFFIRPGNSPDMKIQKASVSGGTLTWSDYSTISTSTLTSLPKDSVYNICLQMDGSGVISVESVVGYTGNFYIRTDAANNKWDNYKSADHMMTYSEYSERNSDYTHYWMTHVWADANVKFVVANDYSPCISDTLVTSSYRDGDASHIYVSTPGHRDGNIKVEANIRFMWNRKNNAVYRAYLSGGKEDGSKFLVLRGTDSDNIKSQAGELLTGESKDAPGNNHGAGAHCMQFTDDENWIYETTVQVLPSSYVKLFALFNGSNFYYKGENNNTFDGNDGDSDGIPNAIQLITGDGSSYLTVRVIYDFKTDRLLAAYLPSGNISTQMHINADVMFIREHQEDIAQLTFTDDGKKITDIKTAYAVMRFNKWTLNNKNKDTHAVLPSPLSRYERDVFYVSFPFDVNLNEVFGFGTYGVHWIMEYYDGAARAAKGFWKDTPSYWRFITNRNGYILKKNVGYILALDLDELGEESSVWANNNERAELFFPSSGTMPDIKSGTVTAKLDEHTCTIVRNGSDRTKADSHWNIMGVPTYLNTTNISYANTEWKNKIGPKFLYTWNSADNTLTPTTATGFTYHAMHAYTVQYYGNVTWTTSVSPSSIVARQKQEPSVYEWCLELQQNDQMTDRTYVRMSDEEEVTSGFEFGYDMSKSMNRDKANIYTFIGSETVAGNSLPLQTEQTTVVPVGVTIKNAGEYTFAMPEGTNGVGVTLVDTEANVRTSLSALDYTVSLEAGEYTGRFMLEISPVQNMPTDIEAVSVQPSEVRKVMIDGILYIVKDGKMYDARGARVE